jgi:hypothetical protein
MPWIFPWILYNYTDSAWNIQYITQPLTLTLSQNIILKLNYRLPFVSNVVLLHFTQFVQKLLHNTTLRSIISHLPAHSLCSAGQLWSILYIIYYILYIIYYVIFNHWSSGLNLRS